MNSILRLNQKDINKKMKLKAAKVEFNQILINKHKIFPLNLKIKTFLCVLAY